MPMPCVPIPNQDPDLTVTKNATWKAVPNIKVIILLKLIQEPDEFKKAAAIGAVDPKYTILKVEKSTGLVRIGEKVKRK
ncbi:hypothetical protein DSO57_1000990 [Entomophthora muscae]|uniref:Uncharacterized protein n=1 Tax=Entomophthora muscae TaxID=34485 RepID=A0ACC2UJB5_9FUNG|nr:hypothetical protein DSO57_1000990 [Entomophthora muscae]